MSSRELLMHTLATDVLDKPIDGITEETILDPWDSLCHIATIAVIDELTGKVVNGSAVSECKTVSDVLRLAAL